MLLRDTDNLRIVDSFVKGAALGVDHSLTPGAGFGVVLFIREQYVNEQHAHAQADTYAHTPSGKKRQIFLESSDNWQRGQSTQVVKVLTVTLLVMDEAAPPQLLRVQAIAGADYQATGARAHWPE